MKKALFLLTLATIVGVGLRYVVPREDILPKETPLLIDDFLSDVIEEEISNDAVPKVDTVGVRLDSIRIVATTDEDKEEAKPVILEEQPMMKQFFSTLERLENGENVQVRIAIFGDSLEDADMLVMQLRHYMQKRFGGMGVGFVPMTSVSASGRYSVKHRFSNNWKKDIFLKREDTTFLFGLTGETFYTGDTTNISRAEVTFRRGTAYKELPLINPILFYGKRQKSDSLQLSLPKFRVFADKDIDSIALSADKLLNEITLPSNKKEITLQIEDQGTIPFYGVSFASETGVIVDNLSIRGNSGLPLRRLNARLMNHFQQHMNYDLLVLAYGTNVFNISYEKSYAWYRRRMEKVVAHLQKGFPNADILIMSVPDRAVKVDETLQTPKKLREFVQEQAKIAKNTKTTFFNFFDAMGGEGSMVEWAEGEPSLANKDYTHFNSLGAEKGARIFYQWLMNQYDTYKIKKKKEIPVSKAEIPDTVQINSIEL